MVDGPAQDKLFSAFRKNVEGCRHLIGNATAVMSILVAMTTVMNAINRIDTNCAHNRLCVDIVHRTTLGRPLDGCQAAVRGPVMFGNLQLELALVLYFCFFSPLAPAPQHEKMRKIIKTSSDSPLSEIISFSFPRSVENFCYCTYSREARRKLF